MSNFIQRIFFFCTVAIALFLQPVFAQPNVFDPNDAVVTYDPQHPVATPPANTLAKWVRSRVYSWNTDKFKAYYFDGMAFRLRFPTGYNPADSTKKYPVIVCYHGGGEIAPITNNEIQLLYPAQKLEAYADAGQYNAFLLFPVHAQGADIWNDFEFTRVNKVLDSLQKYCNLDPDRVLTMGLSMGAFASVRYSAWYAQRSCLAIGASPALIETLPDDQRDKLVHIPVWVGNGEQDINPYPSFVRDFVAYMKSKGGNIRHNFYLGQGHTIWTLQFEEPYFLPYLQGAHKANPVVLFGRNQFDAESLVNSRMGISAGFYQYEWQRDNLTIATCTNGVNGFIDSSAITSSSGNEISVRTYGSYRVRFRRTAASDWSAWSPNPATIYNGLKYRYFEGAWNALPDFSSMNATESGTAPNADISSRPAGREDHFAMIWEGKIYIPAPGDYTFETVSDDGSKLYFNAPYSYNGTPLVNNDGAHGIVSATGTVRVQAAGVYPIAITYFNSLGTGTFQLYWSGPGFTRQRIPNAAFTQRNGNTDDIAPTTPQNLKATDNGRTSVLLSWNKSIDNFGVAKYVVYMNGTEKGSTADSVLTINNLAPNVSYSVSVVAYDAAGNASDSSNSVKVLSSATGLQYKFYRGSWATVPNFNTLVPAAKGTSANIDLKVRPAGADNSYTFLWEGYINIRTPGDYTFETVSDDGSKLYFNTLYSPTATPLVNNDGLHELASASGTVKNLAAGIYPITIAFLQLGGDATMQVYWTGPTIPRQQIPDLAFIENYPDNIAPSVPANLKIDYTGRTFADLSWDASKDNVGIAKYDVYVNSRYRLSTTATSVQVDSLTPNSNYYFEIKAVDAAGNASASNYTQSVTAAANGLKYKFYSGRWIAIPDFNTLATPDKKGNSANADLKERPAGLDNYYTVIWQGYINIKTPGDYTFETVSDDGSKLYFNSFYSPTATPLVNNDGLHQLASAGGTVKNLAVGIYPITIAYLQGFGDATMQVYWTGPSTPRQRIPDAAFTEYYNGYSTYVSASHSAEQATAGDVGGSSKTGLQLAEIYPNPFDKDVKIGFYNPAGNHDISVGVYDLSGRLLYNKRFGKLAEGKTLLQLNLSGAFRLEPGTYMARLQVDGVPVKTWKLVKARR